MSDLNQAHDQARLPFGHSALQPADLRRALLPHQGAANGITCARLAALLGCNERQVRKLVSDCRFDGDAIVGTPTTGYYMAQTPQEIEEFTEFHFHRARHSLAIVSRVKRVALPVLLGQLSLEPDPV